MEEFKAKFLEEASDLITDLEKSLLELEKTPNDKEQIGKVFRIMHTFKGVSAMFGFEKLGEFTHHLETVYDFIRNDELALNEHILNVSLAAIDHIKLLLDDAHLQVPENIEKHETLVQSIVAIVLEVQQKLNMNNTDESNSKIETPQIVQNNINNEVFKTFYINFKPDEFVFLRGLNPLILMEELTEIATCKIFPIFDKIPSFDKLDTSKCYTHWHILAVTNKPLSAIEDVFMFVSNCCVYETIANINLFEVKAIADLLVNYEFYPDKFDVHEVKKTFVNLNARSVKEKVKDAKSSLAIKSENIKSSIKISSDKLDELMNLVSELVTTQAELSVLAQNSTVAKLTSVAENIEKISRRLRDNALNICLVPIEEILVHFQRLVRDLSLELKKNVTFTTQGTDTELDKRIIDSLREPFMHILRNAMDHGIENEEERIAKGKPAQGNILLKSFYSGTNVIIQIIDDGKGLNPHKIRDKAIAKGMINSDAQLTEKELFNIVFLPGFSTAQEITNVSGRGVGMDVVKRKIADLSGEVEIDSTIDVGTTISIKLPLTLSIIDALLVKVSDFHFLIPLSLVERCEEAEHEIIKNAVNSRIIFGEELIPFVNIRKEFHIKGDTPNIERIVIVKHESYYVGLIVDVVVGEHQAVLKPLGEIYKNYEIISGASILGNGEIAQIIDIPKLINKNNHKDQVKENYL